MVDKKLDLIDALLGETVSEENEFIKDVAKKIYNSGQGRRAYILTYRKHYTFDSEMDKVFAINKELRFCYANTYKILNYLVSLDIAVLTNNPKKNKNTPKSFGLRNPYIHEKIITELNNLLKAEKT